jgi:ADP-heptose:LPS heptosyltransferase
LICGSAWKTKQWSAEDFSALGLRWATERYGSVVVFGGAAEQAMVEQICSNIGSQAIPCVQAPLPFVTALLRRCEKAVGNDTGLSFLAIAAGCPQVFVLYGSTQVNYGFPPPHRAITSGVPCCLPRTGHGAHQCQWADETWCMKQISVERVWSEIFFPIQT